MTEETLKTFSWYHGAMGREESNKLLEGKKEGLFLVRKRKGVKNEYVLSVNEINKISHYIILDVNNMYFKIGEQRFADIPSIIEFYKKHTLDSTNLNEPVLRPGTELDPNIVINHLANKDLMKVRAKFNFHGNDPEDLPFKKGDMLTVIRKEEEKWWLARDNTGREGMIPVPYVEVMHSSLTPNHTSPKLSNQQQQQRRTSKPHNYAKPKDFDSVFNHPQIPHDHKGPLFAIAVQNREPSFYDKSMLGFKKGDRIEVIKAHDDGSWEGLHISTGKSGFFPFNHVKLLLDTLD